MIRSIDNSLRYRFRLIVAYHDAVRNYIPFLFRRYCQRFRQSQLAAAHRLQGKERIEVAFFLTIPGMWKSDYLFKELRDNPRYHPYVVIYPYSTYKGFRQDEVEAAAKRTEKFIADKGFEYVIPYDEKKKQWWDVKKKLDPDIVIFTTPYKDFPPKFYIYHFRDRLTCYVPYGFSSLNMYHANYDLIFHNLVGLHFVETELHKQTASNYSRNKGENVVVSGYPGTEVFLRNDYVPKNVWKVQEVSKKKVIWAPHHTIDESLSISTFLTYCDLMPALAEKYKDSIQFVFKPHQLLKFKLQQLWGKERTDAYYAQWDQMSNTQLEESSYVDLFLTSDAMIHDCGSFTTEYLFTRKPVMYLVQKQGNEDKFCPFGKLAFNCHYHGATAEDIERFLQEVVLSGHDEKKAQRQQFYDAYLAPKDGLLPSQKIIQILEDTINGKEQN